MTYNVFLRVALHCIALRKNDHVCICDWRNNKQQALLYTAQNSHLNSQWQKRTYRRQKRQTVLAKLELPHFIETDFVYSWHRRQLSSQVQEIVLHKMSCTHSNIYVELFWKSVVNTTCTLPLMSSCVLFWKPKQSTFTFTTKHSVPKTWCWRQQQYYSENKNHAPFFCLYFWTVLWKSPNFVTYTCGGVFKWAVLGGVAES